MHLTKKYNLILVVIFTLFTSNLFAQVGGGVFAYPSGGQNSEQQSKDQFECHQWSAQQSGFDPLTTSHPSAQANNTSSSSYQSTDAGFGSGEAGQGGRMQDAARGAALGAIGGAIAGDAGEGAAYGAAAATVFGGMKRRGRRREQQNWQQKQQQQAEQQRQAAIQQYEGGMGNYQRGYGACMSSRNYQVQ